MVDSKLQRTGQELSNCLLEHLSNDKSFFNKLNNAFIEYYRNENSIYNKYPYMYENSIEGERQSKEYDKDKQRLRNELANNPIILAAGRKIVEVCGNAAQAYVQEVLKIERNDLKHLQSTLSARGRKQLSAREVKAIKNSINRVKARISLYSRNMQTITHVPNKEAGVFISFVEELREDLRKVASTKT